MLRSAVILAAAGLRLPLALGFLSELDEYFAGTGSLEAAEQVLADPLGDEGLDALKQELDGAKKASLLQTGERVANGAVIVAATTGANGCNGRGALDSDGTCECTSGLKNRKEDYKCGGGWELTSTYNSNCCPPGPGYSVEVEDAHCCYGTAMRKLDAGDPGQCQQACTDDWSCKYYSWTNHQDRGTPHCEFCSQCNPSASGAAGQYSSWKKDDFSAANKAAADSARQALRDFVSRFSRKRKQIYNTFTSNFHDGISSLEANLNLIAQHLSQADGQFETVKNVNSDIEGKEKVVATTADKASLMSGKMQIAMEKLTSSFTKAANKNSQTWYKAATKQTNGYRKEMTKQEKTAAKVMSKVNADRQKAALKALKDSVKSDGRIDKLFDKSTDKASELQDALDEQFDTFDTLLGDQEMHAENNADDVERVAESEDPGDPGAEFKLEEGGEAVDEALEEGNSELDTMGEDNAAEMKYGEEDIQSHFEEAAETLAERNEKTAETLAKTGTMIGRATTKANGANTAKEQGLEAAVMEEYQHVFLLASQVEQLDAHTEAFKEQMATEIEAMIEQTTHNLEELFEEHKVQFEQKDETFRSWLESLQNKERTDLTAKVGDIAGQYLGQIQKAADGAAGYAQQAGASIEQGKKMLEVAVKKMDDTLMAQQSQEVQMAVLPEKATEIEAELVRIHSAKADALQKIQSATKGILKHLDESRQKGEQDMHQKFAATLNEVKNLSDNLAAHITDTAGKSYTALNDMINDNLDKMNGLKIDVEVGNAAMNLYARTLVKEQKLLDAVPEYFTATGADTVQNFRDTMSESDKWAKDMEAPVTKAVEKCVQLIRLMLETADESVSSEATRSAQRINAQYQEVSQLLQQAKQSQDAFRTEAKRRGIVLNSEITGDLGDMENRGRKAHAEIEDRERQEKADAGGFAMGLQAVQSLFGQITDTTHVEAGKEIAAFHDKIATSVNDFNQAVLHTSEATGKATLQAKTAVQAEMGKDNIEFKQAISRSLTQLQIVANDQARLHMEMANSAAKDGVAHGDDALQAVLANQKAVAALMERMNGSVDEIAAKATKRISDSVTSHDRDRTQMEAALQGSLKELQAEQYESKQDFHRKIESVHADALAKEAAMHGAVEGMKRSMVAVEAAAQQKEGLEEAEVEKNERKVVAHLQDMMLRQRAFELGEETEQDREGMEAQNVEQVMAQTAKRVDKDTERAEAEASAQIQKLEPTQQGAQLKAEVSTLSENFKNEMARTTKLEDESESEAIRLQERSNDAVSKGLEELAKLAPGIQKEAERGASRFEELNDTLASSHLDVSNELSELNELALDMKTAMANKGHDMSHKLHLVEDEVSKMAEMTKYAEGGQLERIIETLRVGLDQTTDINGMVDSSVKPKTKDLRKRTGQVFEDNGMALNMERVDAMGNKTMQEEITERQRLLAAREGLESILHETARDTQHKLTSVYEETKHLIAQVESMAHLSEAEKAAKIKDIKAEAARKTAMIMANARAQIQSQMKTEHNIGKKEEGIKVLIQRAHGLASGTFQTTNAGQIKQLLEETKKRDQAIRDKWITGGGSAESLLETQESAAVESDQALEADEDAAVADQSGPWTPAKELRGDLADAENLALHRESEDARLEDELRQLRSVSS